MTDNFRAELAEALREVRLLGPLDRERIFDALLPVVERALDRSNRLAFQAGWNHATAGWEQRAAEVRMTTRLPAGVATATNDEIRARLIAALPGAHPWGEVVDLLLPTVRVIAAEELLDVIGGAS